MNLNYIERKWRPILWWEVAALQEPRAQVFERLFCDCLGEAATLCRKLSVELNMREWCEPIQDWQIEGEKPDVTNPRLWGEFGGQIAEWFADGECLKDEFEEEPEARSLIGALRSWARRLAAQH